MIQPPQRNQPNSDDIAILGAFGGWFGSLLTAVILMVAVRNLGINTRTLALTSENLENTKRNAENTATMISELQKINEHLERL